MPKLGRALHFDKLLRQFVYVCACMLERTCTATPQTPVGGNTAGESHVFSGHQQTQPACSVGCTVGVRPVSDGDVDKQRKIGSHIGFLKRCHMALAGHINMTLYLGIKLGASLTTPSRIFTEYMAPTEAFLDHTVGSTPLLVTPYLLFSEVSSYFLVVGEVMLLSSPLGTGTLFVPGTYVLSMFFIVCSRQ